MSWGVIKKWFRLEHSDPKAKSFSMMRSVFRLHDKYPMSISWELFSCSLWQIMRGGPFGRIKAPVSNVIIAFLTANLLLLSLS